MKAIISLFVVFFAIAAHAESFSKEMACDNAIANNSYHDNIKERIMSDSLANGQVLAVEPSVGQLYFFSVDSALTAKITQDVNHSFEVPMVDGNIPGPVTVVKVKLPNQDTLIAYRELLIGANDGHETLTGVFGEITDTKNAIPMEVTPILVAQKRAKQVFDTYLKSRVSGIAAHYNILKKEKMPYNLEDYNVALHFCDQVPELQAHVAAERKKIQQ